MNNPYAKIIQDAASKHGVPANILTSLLQQESGFAPDVINGTRKSSAGALGIAQFMPATAKSYGINPLDPNQAIPAAAQYLSNSYKQFGNWPSALASYNAGVGAVQKYGGVPPFAETQNYVKNIMAMAGMSDNANQSSAPTSAANTDKSGKYTVQPGDTLSGIGKKLGFDWSKITGYKSGNPDLIYPGEQLNTPQTQPQQAVASAPNTTQNVVSAAPATKSLLDMVIPPAYAAETGSATPSPSAAPSAPANFDYQAAKSAGYSDQEIQDFLKSNPQAPSQEPSNLGMFTGALKNTGLSEIPIVGGLLNAIAKGGEYIAEGGAAGAKQLGAATGIRPIQPSDVNPTFMSPADAQQATQNSFDTNRGGLLNVPNALARQGGEVGVNAGLSLDAAASLPGLLKNLPNAAGYLTSKCVGQKIGTKVADATAKGAADTWHDFSTEVLQTVENRLGKGKEYANIVKQRLSAEAPATLDEGATITPQRLLDLRRQAAAREPQGIFQQFQGKSATNQVDEIIRDVASKRVKDLAGTGNLDKLYSVYAKVGSPAKLGSNAIVSYLSSKLLPDNQEGPAAVGGALGLTVLRQLLHL